MGDLDGEETMQPSLLELPDELLLKVLVGAGGRAVGSTTTVCKRMQAAKEALSQHAVFASASSQLPQLEDALRDAATRAMEGMLGAVSFALLFTCNYPHPKKYRDPGDVSNAADILASHLPKGTPVVGCTVAGLMGVGSDGRPFEIDPDERNRRGVSVLLGHMPHAVVRLFADTQPHTPARRGSRKSSDGNSPPPPWTPIEQWVGIKRDGLLPVSAWLMSQSAQGARSAARAINPEEIVEWIQRQVPPGAAPVAVAGGVASGRAPELLFLPGRQEEEVGAAPDWDPMEGVRKARYVGLMVCAKAGTPPPAMGLPSGAAPCSAAHTLTGNPSTLPHLQGSGGSAGTACAGSGGGTSVGACGVRSTGSVEGGPCAAVLSMRGVGSHAGSSWWGGLQLDVVHLEEEDCFIINIRDVSSLRRIGHASAHSPSTAGAAVATAAPAAAAAVPHPTHSSPGEPSPQEKNPSEARGSDGQGQGSPGGVQGSAAQGEEAGRQLPRSFTEEYLELGGGQGMASEHLMLALFRSDATPTCTQTGLTPEVMDSGLCIVSGLGHCPVSGAFRVAVESGDGAAIKEIMALGPRHVCCQIASISPETIRKLMARELGIARQLCRPAPFPGSSSGPAADARRWEGYAQLREAAHAAGARSGPVGMAVFTCTGRGQSIFGQEGDCEAVIADEVLDGDVPLVGAFCDGEIGPYVRNGYVGWSVSGSAQSSYSAPSTCTLLAANPAAAHAAGGAAKAGAAGKSGAGMGAGDEEEGGGEVTGATATQAYVALRGRAVEQCACTLQGWTSMFSLVS